MLVKGGKNYYEHQFWTLHVPRDDPQPGMEIGVVIDDKGIRIGGGLIPWADIDEARKGIEEDLVRRGCTVSSKKKAKA